jgi:peptidoglycan/LPS O-acetylase OafA/YrhL
MNWNIQAMSGLIHLWSMCLEEWCYLVFLLLIPFLRSRYMILFFVGLALIPLAGRILHLMENGPVDGIRYIEELHTSTLLHWDSFWIGCIVGYWYYGKKSIGLQSQRWLLFMSLLPPVAYAFLRMQDARWALVAINLFSPWFGALSSIGLVLGLPCLPEKWLRRTGLPAVGTMAYSIYLIHTIVLYHGAELNRRYEFVPRWSYQEMVLLYIAVLAFSAVFFFIFERPCLKWLRSHAQRKTVVIQALPSRS